jgi:hypothetical protein
MAFDDHVDKSGDCWLWTGALNEKGYGVFRNPETGKTTKAHKYSWVRTNGPVPSGKELAHSCHIRRCVNPSHINPKLHIDNIRDQEVVKRNKTHCKRGHELTYANTYISSLGYKQCITCRDMLRKRRDERRKRKQQMP